MKTIVYYQGNYPIIKNYNSDNWDEVSLKIIDDVLRRSFEGEYELDTDDFDPYRDIIIIDFKTKEDLELSENLTNKHIQEVINKYI